MSLHTNVRRLGRVEREREKERERKGTNSEEDEIRYCVYFE